jgi:hypothetical protein
MACLVVESIDNQQGNTISDVKTESSRTFKNNDEAMEFYNKFGYVSLAGIIP